jgi:RNA polymerase sigma-70 factor, ECF subfamily
MLPARQNVEGNCRNNSQKQRLVILNHLTMGLLVDNASKLEAFRRGDQSVLEEVYHAYVDDVTMLVRRGFHYNRDKAFTVFGISDEQQQYDIIQETFARGFSERVRTSYDGHFPFKLYLLRITKNLMIDQLRRGSRDTSLGHQNSNSVGDIDDILEKQIPYVPENPAVVAHRERQQKAVSDFVGTLGLPEQNFYRKRYVLGFSQEKTAAQLQISRRNVRTMEKRLCKGLKAYLKKAGLWP